MRHDWLSHLFARSGAFITGSDFLMDGGVAASYWFGQPAS